MYKGPDNSKAHQAYAAERQGPRRPLDPAGRARQAPRSSLPLSARLGQPNALRHAVSSAQA